LREVTAIERQVNDLFVVDHLPHRRTFGFNQRRHPRYRNLVGDLSDLQVDVYARFLIDLQNDIRHHGLSETLQCGGYLVSANRQ
jgi:hypothetical protein